MAVGQLGKKDGFLGDKRVRIPLPDGLQTVEKAMRGLGMKKQADGLIETMNRAAEMAVLEARPILSQAVKNMSFDDARGILTGGDDAATQYFKRTTSSDIAARFLPIVKKATSKVDLAGQYNQYAGKAAKFGLLDKKDADLDSYVTHGPAIAASALAVRESYLQEQNALGPKVQAANDMARMVVGVLVVVALLVGIGTAWFLIRSVLAQLGADPAELAGVARRIADGDLTVPFAGEQQRGVYADMKLMAGNLASVIGEVRGGAENVAAGSEQLSASAESLSQGATEQAASIEEISASMEEMTANIRQNMENARQTETIAVQAAVDAESGGKAVTETVVAMRDIADKGAVEGGFFEIGGGVFAGQVSFAHEQYPVAVLQEFREIVADDQDGQPVLGQPLDDAVDRVLRADVDPDGRPVQDEHARLDG